MTKLKLDLLCQIAVVVRDLESGLKQMRELFGFDETSVSFSNSRELIKDGKLQNIMYNGKEGKFSYRQVNFYMGGMDIEMFAPVDDESNPITDFLEEHGPGIHHVNIRLVNREEGIRWLREEMGIEPFYDLYNHGRSCTFFDLRKQLGIVLEIGSRVVGPRASMSEEEIKALVM